MTVTAIANEINDDVFLELLAILKRQTRHEDYGFRIIAVYVEDRCFDHLCNVGTVVRRTCVGRPARRKADLVVDNDVYGAARTETIGLRHLERLGDNALARECCVSVNKNRHHFFTFGVTTTLLARTNGSLNNGIDDLKMRRIERECNVHAAARCLHIR